MTESEAYFFPSFILLLASLALAPARAWEPAQVDVTQQLFAPDSESSDHLEPTSGVIDEKYYLVRFACYKAMAYQNDLFTITRRDSDGSYTLRKWSEWAKTDTAPPQTEKLRPTLEMSIPKDMAQLLYDMWVNALYEVRYDRTANGTLDGWTDVYTVFVRGKGWMSGGIDTPEKELPPKWLETAANAVLQFAEDHDTEVCRTKLTQIHKKLFVYWKAHGISPDTDLRMHP